MLKVYQMNIAPLLDEAVFLEKLQKLPGDRQEKILSYRVALDRCRSLAAWLLLYDALATEGIDMAGVSFSYGKNKKPYVDGSGLFFSLSHSGEMAVCVISDSEVGCDIEKLDRFAHRDHKSLERIARRVMSEAEYDMWLKDPTGEALVKLWTKKESYAKYTGEGLACDFASVDTSSLAGYCHPKVPESYYLTIFAEKCVIPQ